MDNSRAGVAPLPVDTQTQTGRQTRDKMQCGGARLRQVTSNESGRPVAKPKDLHRRWNPKNQETTNQEIRYRDFNPQKSKASPNPHEKAGREPIKFLATLTSQESVARRPVDQAGLNQDFLPRTSKKQNTQIGIFFRASDVQVLEQPTSIKRNQNHQPKPRVAGLQ